MPDNAVLSQRDQDFLKECASFSDARLDAYALYESYYDGDQNVKLTDRTKKFLEQHGSQVKWCENFCEPVVDILAERLVLTGFGIYAGDEPKKPSILKRLVGKKTEDVTEQLHAYVDDLLEQNHVDSMQDVAHTTALVKGDVFLVAYVEDGKPCLTWNPPENFKVLYSKEKPDEMALAIKRWTTNEETPQNPEGDEITRMNLYYPNQVEKYYQAGTDGPWSRWQTEGESWPVTWPGMTVFHLKYKSLGRSYGRSREKAAIPFQDELNKQVVDLNMVMDHLGWPQRYAFGVDIDQGQLDAMIGDYLTSGNAETKVGQFDAADPSGILDSIEQILSRLARRCRIPLHLITTGAVPSGESFKAANAGIDSTARLTQTEWGSVWENAVRMLIRLGQVYGDAPDADLDTLTIRCEWEQPDYGNEKEHLEAAVLKKELGVSNDTLLTELGYNPEEEREKRASELAESKQRADMFFNAGNAEGAANEEPAATDEEQAA
ncbi:MAG: phage portal protein [Bacteroidales bacterium]|nr:phage portal protein [Bacteroidales bacterium]